MTFSDDDVGEATSVSEMKVAKIADCYMTHHATRQGEMTVWNETRCATDIAVRNEVEIMWSLARFTNVIVVGVGSVIHDLQR